MSKVLVMWDQLPITYQGREQIKGNMLAYSPLKSFLYHCFNYYILLTNIETTIIINKKSWKSNKYFKF